MVVRFRSACCNDRWCDRDGSDILFQDGRLNCVGFMAFEHVRLSRDGKLNRLIDCYLLSTSHFNL